MRSHTGNLTDEPCLLLQRQVSPFLQQVFMPLVLAIFEVLARPAEDNDQAAALEKQMLRRSYFTFIQTVTGSGMNEVMANQGELPTGRLSASEGSDVLNLEN